MTLTTSTITGRVPLPTDENLQFAELTFALSGLDTEGASVLPGGVSTRIVLIDSDIPAGFELWQNTAGLHGTHYRVLVRWKVKDRDGIRDQYADLGVIQIGSDPSYTLADLINNGVLPAIGTFWSAITQAQYDAVIQAAADAQASAADAQASATAAAMYDGPWMDTVSALIADTSLTYTPAQPSTVSAGDYVRTRAEGFAYQVAASGAVDQHITTAGGVKLYVMPNDAGSYNVKAFGADNLGISDNATIFAKVTALVASSAQAIEVVFPNGIYKYSASPNWAHSNAKYTFGGEVRLRYTGTGNAVTLDGGATGPGVYNCRFGDGGRVKVECPSNAGHAIYVRAYHLGLVRGQVMGAGTASAGIKTAWLVSTDIDVRCSVNEEGWYNSGSGVAKPAIGFDLDIRGAGEQTSYCNITNPDASGPGIGIQLSGTLGNNIWGGAFQSCSSYGLFASTGSSGDKFFGTDFEVNGAADIYCVGGNRIRFHDCDTDAMVIFGANSTDCGLIGGKHKSITIDLGARNARLEGCTYNRSNTGGTISDSGTGTIRRDCTRDNVFNVTDAAAEREEEIYVRLVDDFLGDILAANWSGIVGTDPQCAAPGIAGSVVGGLMSMKAGDDAAADFAVNGVQFNQGALHWRSNQKGLELTARFYIDAITDVSVFFGLTDTALFEMPFTLGAGDALTSNASNAVGVLFDTAADTDQWHLVGVKADVDATKQALGVAPVASTHQTFKLYVDSAGTARLFRNGVAIGTDMTNAVTNSTLLTPCFAMFSRTTATRLLACDFISIRAQRA